NSRKIKENFSILCSVSLLKGFNKKKSFHLEKLEEKDYSNGKESFKSLTHFNPNE
ncbi:hypothetical protein TNCT_436891, partial [Trichonephila clavata]